MLEMHDTVTTTLSCRAIIITGMPFAIMHLRPADDRESTSGWTFTHKLQQFYDTFHVSSHKIRRRNGAKEVSYRCLVVARMCLLASLELTFSNKFAVDNYDADFFLHRKSTTWQMTFDTLNALTVLSKANAKFAMLRLKID